MKRALIDPRTDRLVQVELVENEFSVAAPLFWIDVADEVTIETHIYDGTQVVVRPPPPPPPTIDNLVAEEFNARVFAKGLVRLLAERFNVTEQQVLNTIITKAKQ